MFNFIILAVLGQCLIFSGRLTLVKILSPLHGTHLDPGSTDQYSLFRKLCIDQCACERLSDHLNNFRESEFVCFQDVADLLAGKDQLFRQFLDGAGVGPLLFIPNVFR